MVRLHPGEQRLQAERVGVLILQTEYPRERRPHAGWAADDARTLWGCRGARLMGKAHPGTGRGLTDPPRGQGTQAAVGCLRRVLSRRGADAGVIDLGGTVESWKRAPVRPLEVVVVDMLEPGEACTPGLIPVLGDACRARDVLSESGVEPGFDASSPTRCWSTSVATPIG